MKEDKRSIGRVPARLLVKVTEWQQRPLSPTAHALLCLGPAPSQCQDTEWVTPDSSRVSKGSFIHSANVCEGTSMPSADTAGPRRNRTLAPRPALPQWAPHSVVTVLNPARKRPPPPQAPSTLLNLPLTRGPAGVPGHLCQLGSQIPPPAP